MASRFVGYRGRQISFVGTQTLETESLKFLELLPSLAEIPSSELIENYEIRDGVIAIKRVAVAQMRVALVSVYGIPCGIATYSGWLWEKIQERVAESHIFSSYDDHLEDTPGMTQSWRAGQPLSELIAALRAYDPDIIFVQHEYGHFPVARYWLSFVTALHDYPIVTTLHSVYEHQDKTVCEAALSHIVVHTESAAAMLRQTKQVKAKVTVIPHGCTPCTSHERFWNIYGSNHTLIQFGFGFSYKGWPNALEVVAALKETYPDVFFTGLFSERWPDRHSSYYQELDEMIDDLKIRDHVALIRGFQSDVCLNSYLRTNRVAIFPYVANGKHTVLGCSGAARFAMSKGIPVVTSSVPHFEDLEGICPRPSDVAGWVEAVEALFASPTAQLERQDAFLEANSWDHVATRYLDLAQEILG